MIKVDFCVPMSRMAEITTWLLSNIGASWLDDRHLWSFGEHYESVYFSDERHAIVFKLKWAGNENI